MSIRRTITLMLLIVALAGAAGAKYVYTLWTRSDEMLRERLIATIRELAPEWQFDVGTARFGFQGIRVYNFKLKTRAGGSFINLPEAVIVYDREQIAEQKLLIHQIRLLQPQLVLARDRAGQWSFQGIPLPKSMHSSLPEIQIEQGTITLEVESENLERPLSLVLRDVNLHLVPSGKQQFAIAGTTLVEQAGALRVDGEWNIEQGSWSLEGGIQKLKLETGLLDLATSTVPELQQKLQKLLNRGAAGAPQVAVAGLEFELTTDVKFRLARWNRESDLEYKLLLNVLAGQVECSRLPFSLHDLRARLVCDNRQVLIEGLTARNGVTHLAADGKFVRQGPEMPGECQLAVRELTFDPRLRNILSPQLQCLYDDLHPVGKTDITLALQYDGAEQWTCATTALIKDATATHVKFPYEIEHINGTIRNAEGVCELALEGRAGRRPISLVGRVERNKLEVFKLAVDDLPIDDKFIVACPAEVQATLRSLSLRGQGNLRMQFSRPQVSTGKFDMQLSADLRKCVLNFKGFPYALSDLQGRIELSRDRWTFRDLQGIHGTGVVSGRGTFQSHRPTGALELTLNVREADLDKDLQLAMPGSWRTIWDEFSPTGKINSSVQVVWSPGGAPRLVLDVDLLDAGVAMKSFPFPIDGITGKLTLADSKFQITGFAGHHDETQIRLKGHGDFDADGTWRCRLEELFVDRLQPDRRFRVALPRGFREVIESLDPRGNPVSFSGMLEFRGTGDPRDYVTAAWDIETVHTGTHFTAGVDVENIYGRAFMRGKWDGEHVTSEGRIEFDSLWITKYQFTQVLGPVGINGNQLVIGSKEVANVDGTTAGSRVEVEKRLSARAIDGVFTLDGIAVLDESTSYRVVITMNGGKLERYAQLYLPGGVKLRGVMNGWVELNGRGTDRQRLNGRGQMQISPAALYELPVIVSIFKILKFLPPDKTAFDYAMVNFDVGNSQFSLRQIDLVGNAMSLRGRGVVRFDGKLDLEFFSSMGRNQIAIPIVQQLVGEATKDWVGVEVHGTTSDPVPTVKAVPRLDEALKRFLGAFEPPRAPTRQ